MSPCQEEVTAVFYEKLLQAKKGIMLCCQPESQTAEPVPLPWRELKTEPRPCGHLQQYQRAEWRKARLRTLSSWSLPWKTDLEDKSWWTRGNSWMCPCRETIPEKKQEGCSMGKVISSWMRLFLWCKGAKGSCNRIGSQQGSKSTGASIFAMRVNSKRKAQSIGKRSSSLKGRGKKRHWGWGEQTGMKLEFTTALT